MPPAQAPTLTGALNNLFLMWCNLGYHVINEGIAYVEGRDLDPFLDDDGRPKWRWERSDEGSWVIGPVPGVLPQR